jgi:hypothetical protein
LANIPSPPEAKAADSAAHRGRLAAEWPDFHHFRPIPSFDQQNNFDN